METTRYGLGSRRNVNGSGVTGKITKQQNKCNKNKGTKPLFLRPLLVKLSIANCMNWTQKGCYVLLIALEACSDSFWTRDYLNKLRAVMGDQIIYIFAFVTRTYTLTQSLRYTYPAERTYLLILQVVARWSARWTWSDELSYSVMFYNALSVAEGTRNNRSKVNSSESLFDQKQDTNSSDKHIELTHFDYDLTFRMYSTYIFKSNRSNLKQLFDWVIVSDTRWSSKAYKGTLRCQL